MDRLWVRQDLALKSLGVFTCSAEIIKISGQKSPHDLGSANRRMQNENTQPDFYIIIFQMKPNKKLEKRGN